MARILHNNRVKFPKDFFSIVLCTNMAAMTSSENHLLRYPVDRDFRTTGAWIAVHLLLLIQWNLSFGTPLFKSFKGHLNSGDTKFDPEKLFS